jgi:hypothetical protein
MSLRLRLNKVPIGFRSCLDGPDDDPVARERQTMIGVGVSKV